MKDFKALLKGENIINKDLNAKKKKKNPNSQGLRSGLLLMDQSRSEEECQ